MTICYNSYFIKSMWELCVMKLCEFDVVIFENELVKLYYVCYHAS